MENRNGAATGSMVLGLLSVILSLVIGAVFPWASLILGIIGLVLAVQARKTTAGGMVTAGFVLSLIGVILSGVLAIMWIACAGVISTAVNDAIGFAAKTNLL